MKNIYPVKYPPITHAPCTAYLLSMIWSDEKCKNDVNDWIFSNYINIRYQKDALIDDFYRYTDLWNGCPFIKNIVKQREIGDEFTKFLIDTLNSKNTIYTFVNKKYIKNYNCKIDDDHNVFIFGIDEAKNMVYIADFFNLKKYSFETCTIQEIEEGYYNLNLVPNINKKIPSPRIEILSRTANAYSLDIDLIKKKFIEYKESTNLMNDVVQSFGLSYYDTIIPLLLNTQLYMMRPLHLLYDRSYIMNLRLDYLKKYYILNNYDMLKSIIGEMIKKAEVSRNLYVKYMILKDNNILEKIKCEIEEIQLLDKEFTELIIYSL